MTGHANEQAGSLPAATERPAVALGMQAAILAWYDSHGRRLAFRATADPYAILVSEAMAQQTQAERAAEAWVTFLSLYPTFEALAAATPAAVLRAWRGLGYNRRALALRRTALEVVERGGALPDDPAELERLPGIGPYTARAVAALAFGRPVGAVDTNVGRVLARAVRGVERAAAPAREIQALADAAVPGERPGDWTHALMDVGARFCRPIRPRCAACPVEPWCRFAASHQGAGGGEIPRPVRRATPRHAVGERVAPFPTTARWLRGRILDRLRDGADGAWVELVAPIGNHDGGAIEAALAGLARDGLIERDPERRRVARLPVA